jgi:hypothetical protein
MCGEATRKVLKQLEISGKIVISAYCGVCTRWGEGLSEAAGDLSERLGVVVFGKVVG